MSAIPQPSKKDVIKGILFLLVAAFLVVNVVVWYVEQTDPSSDTNRKSRSCVAQVEAQGLRWTDVPAYGDAIDDCENGF